MTAAHTDLFGEMELELALTKTELALEKGETTRLSSENERLQRELSIAYIQVCLYLRQC